MEEEWDSDKRRTIACFAVGYAFIHSEMEDEGLQSMTLFSSLLRFPKESTYASHVPSHASITCVEKQLFFGGNYKQYTQPNGDKVICFDYPLD